MRFLFASLMVLFTFSLAPQSAMAFGTSIECGSYDRYSAAEQTICESRYLRRLDRRMTRAYNRAFEEAPDSEARRLVRRTQRDWLRWRGRCGADEDCLERRYNRRIKRLRVFANEFRDGGY